MRAKSSCIIVIGSPSPVSENTRQTARQAAGSGEHGSGRMTSSVSSANSAEPTKHKG